MKHSFFPIGQGATRHRDKKFIFEFGGTKVEHESFSFFSYVQHHTVGGGVLTTRFRDGEQIVLTSKSGTNFRVDGALRQKNGQFSVLEYLECRMNGSHGVCENCATTKETDKQASLRHRTYDRIRQLRLLSQVESVTYIWSCEWEKQQKSSVEVAEFLQIFNPTFCAARRIYERESDIICDILAGRLRCYVFMTVEVLPQFHRFFESFPFLFAKHHCVALGRMKEFLEQNGVKNIAQEKLVPTFSRTAWFHFEEIIAFKTLGFTSKIRMFDIVEIYESRFEQIFQKPMIQLEQMRVRFEQNDQKIHSKTVKAIANYSFGSTIMNLQNRFQTKLVNEKEFLKLVQRRHYVAADMLSEDTYEVQLAPFNKLFKLPYFVGFTILALSKM